VNRLAGKRSAIASSARPANLEAAWEAAQAGEEDPLDQVLAFVGWFEQRMGELTQPYPGCLFASYIGQAQLFDEQTLGIARTALARRRVELGEKLIEVAEQHPPVETVDPSSLADAMNVVFEGRAAPGAGSGGTGMPGRRTGRVVPRLRV